MSTASSASSTTSFRLQVTCDGMDAKSGARELIQALALRELEGRTNQLRLANIRVARFKHNALVCDVQLFGHGLDHAGGHCEHPQLEDAVSAAVHRALCSLETPDRFDPWISPPPSSQRCGQ